MLKPVFLVCYLFLRSVQGVSPETDAAEDRRGPRKYPKYKKYQKLTKTNAGQIRAIQVLPVSFRIFVVYSLFWFSYIFCIFRLFSRTPSVLRSVGRSQQELLPFSQLFRILSQLGIMIAGFQGRIRQTPPRSFSNLPRHSDQLIRLNFNAREFDNRESIYCIEKKLVGHNTQKHTLDIFSQLFPGQLFTVFLNFCGLIAAQIRVVVG